MIRFVFKKFVDNVEKKKFQFEFREIGNFYRSEGGLGG